MSHPSYSVHQSDEELIDHDAWHNCIRFVPSTLSPNEQVESFCDLCKKSLLTSLLPEHLMSRIHQKNHFNFKIDSIVDSIGTLCPPQEEAITQVLSKCAENLLAEEDVKHRQELVNELEKVFTDWTNTSCKLRIFGSTLSGFATKASDLNVELILNEPEGEDSFQLLDKIYQKMLLDKSNFLHTDGEFDIATPRLTFIFRQAPYEIVLSVGSHTAFEMSKLLSLYTTFDPRLAQLAVCFRYWANCASLDRYEFGFWPPHVFPILVIHFLQNCSPPILPSIHPSPASKNIVTLEDVLPIYQVQSSSWSTKNTQSLGVLWVEFLKYYARDFEIDSHVVTLREPGKPIEMKSKKWTTTILAVEDPLRLDHNLARSIGERRLYAHFNYMLFKSYHYYMTPRGKDSPFLQPEFFELTRVKNEKDSLSWDPSLDNLELSDRNSEQEDESLSEAKDSKEDPKKPRKGDLTSHYYKKLRKYYGIRYQYKASLVRNWENLNSSDFCYFLDLRVFDFYKDPPKYCNVCRKCGHMKKECQSTKLPNLVDLPPEMPYNIKVELDIVCEKIYKRTRIDPTTVNNHLYVLSLLSKFISPKFPNSKLELFGSSCNGFGAKTCDLDICLTFSDDPTGQKVDQAATIKSLAKILRKYQGFISQVFPITQAKVPIVKFKIRLKEMNRMSFDCDISLYNLLASRNTLLLRHYCAIDDRVSKLGIIVKKFFKVCQICDASKGSLSSYAYTLMTLFYLQRCQPPVIPVLQELYEGEKPTIMCEGYNTWFFDDLNRLDQVWPQRNKNISSIGELFLGFLRYFSEEFQFNRLVVCIRQSKELTKLEKRWTGKQIAIEDPFLLAHNLGQALGPDMARFIKASIIMGRNHIGKPLHHPEANSLYWEDYFFDQKALISGRIPRKGCHVCGCIGHLAASCPKKFPQLQEQLSDSDSSSKDELSETVKIPQLPRSKRRNNANHQLSRGRTAYYGESPARANGGEADRPTHTRWTPNDRRRLGLLDQSSREPSRPYLNNRSFQNPRTPNFNFRDRFNEELRLRRN